MHDNPDRWSRAAEVEQAARDRGELPPLLDGPNGARLSRRYRLAQTEADAAAREARTLRKLVSDNRIRRRRAQVELLDARRACDDFRDQKVEI